MTKETLTRLKAHFLETNNLKAVADLEAKYPDTPDPVAKPNPKDEKSTSETSKPKEKK